MSVRYLDRLLTPTCLAVVGASSRPGSVGSTVWRNLRAGGFRGPVWPVNPKYAALDGETVYARPSQLPGVPDSAVICTPPATLPALIDELGALGTRAVIVMTAGLSAEQKSAMLAAARPHVLRVLGPNCLGLLSPGLGLNASFAHTDALPGDMAFVSQSGALVTAMLDWAKTRGIGFSHMVSLGEHADVDFGDLLDHLAGDPHTRSILLYIESIEAPRKFMSAARAAARNKPVIVVKAGRAVHGAAAAASHTGALAASDLVFDAAIRRAGMLRVNTLQELFVAAQTLSRFGADKDDRLCIMTNGGGAGVLAADAADAAQVALAELSPNLQARLDAVLPATWSHANPIDIIGDAPAQRYVDTLQALLADRSSGAVLFMHAPTAIVRSDDIARACAPFVRQAAGRVMACWLGDASVAEARRIFTEAGVADYETPEEAVRAFAMLATYRRNQSLLLETPGAAQLPAPQTELARSIVAAALADQRLMLAEHESKALLKAYGISVVDTVITAPTAPAAITAGLKIGFPLALKIVSPDITHKSDAGGVRLDIRDASQLGAAAEEMLKRVAQVRPQARITGFTVQAMVSRPFAQELIVGASVDPLFGPVLLFGQGGTAVETVADRAVALPPMNRALARDLISRTRIFKLLQGYRNHPPARLDEIEDVLIALSQLLADIPEIAELDINPLWADDDGAIALDARVRLDPLRPAGAAHFAIKPYPNELSETLSWQGQALHLRPIKPEDEPQHRTFIGRLTPADLHFRFFSARRELAHAELARLTQIDYDREMAFIATRAASDGQEETLGVIRAVVDPDNVNAEIGVLVRSDLQHRELGSLLMRKLLAFLQQRGTQRATALSLQDNAAMRDLALKFEFTREQSREPGTVCFTRRLGTPSSNSLA